MEQQAYWERLAGEAEALYPDDPLRRLLHRGIAIGYDSRAQRLVAERGKLFTPIKVPKGLPRYRTAGQCYRNAQAAALDDDRLRYVEGVARSHATNMWIGHAWVTMDGFHAIDLTWRGQTVPLCRKESGLTDTTVMNPASEYFGVEIPTADVGAFLVASGWYSFMLSWSAERAREAA